MSANISVKTQSGTIVYVQGHNKQSVLQILGMWKHINMSARKIPGTAINTADMINSISSVNKSLIYSLRKPPVACYQVLSHISYINKQRCFCMQRFTPSSSTPQLPGIPLQQIPCSWDNLIIKPVEQRQSRASSVSWASEEHSFKRLFAIPAPSRNPAFGSPWQAQLPLGCWGSWLWVSSCATAPRARASFSSTELAQVGEMPNFSVWSGFFQSCTPGTAATWKMHHTLLLLLSIITIKPWEHKI